MKFIYFLSASLILAATAQADIVLYTDRTPDVVGPIVTSFEQKTGEKVTFLPFKDATQILQRVESDVQVGAQADLIYVNGIVPIAEFKKKNLLQPINSAVVEANIPAHLRAPDKTWTALTYRARTIVYNSLLNTEKFEFDIDTINTYADLAKPELEDNICVRTSEHSYNRALIAGLITKYGYEPAKDMVSGWVANFAENYPTTDGDSVILKKMTNGDCQIAIVNSYYLASAIAAKSNYNLSIKFLNQEDGGVMTNGTIAAVLSLSKQPEKAQLLLEFMTEKAAQAALSEEHKDYPANPNAKRAAVLEQFPAFKANETNWADQMLNLDAAKTLATEVGYK